MWTDNDLQCPRLQQVSHYNILLVDDNSVTRFLFTLGSHQSLALADNFFLSLGEYKSF